MIILAIETSCDETAVAVVEFKKNKVRVLSNVISSQIKAHSKFGGVVPSLAARMHLKNMVPVLKKAMREAEKHIFKNPPNPLFQRGNSAPPFAKGAGGIFDKNKIDYIAVTKGPGLIPALTIGVSVAKALAFSLDKPLVGVNHLEGHIYANWLTSDNEIPPTPFAKSSQPPLRKGESSRSPFRKGGWGDSFNLWKPKFPVLCLIVSGGHTQLVLMKKDLDYQIIGETRDDAVGEAFDKVARLLGLGYPGGPLIEKIAKKGDKNKFKFPRPMMNSKDYEFSFSGLKTAVLYEMRGFCDCRDAINRRLYDNKYKQDIAASFQEAVIDVLVSKTIRVAKKYKVKNILLGGGVSANKELQRRFIKSPQPPFSKGEVKFHPEFSGPNSNLSTDNALMIAIAGYYNIINNKNIKTWRNVEADANLRLK